MRDAARDIGEGQSQKKGKNYCSECLKKCLVCGGKVPMYHEIGADVKLSRYASAIKTVPGIGSGLCMTCFLTQFKKEQAAQHSIKDTTIIIETSPTWTCPYCKAVNTSNYCFNCGSVRKMK